MSRKKKCSLGEYDWKPTYSGRRSLNVKVTVTGDLRGYFYAEACVRKPLASTRIGPYSVKPAHHHAKGRSGVSRCGEGRGPSPARAISWALAALAKKVRTGHGK
jgi:hypothetical protein